jgi:UDP-N-acetylglucosamine 2-epimerase (non-hydrolysing)
MTRRAEVKVAHVVGTRPNFMKVAPVMAAVDEWNATAATGAMRFEQTLIHTGQHYDRVLSQVFFDQLEMPEPDEHLGVGSGTRAKQLARLLEELEPVLVRHAPDVVIVPGDVNSTCAGALAASGLGIPVAHLEAGLRSGDRTMPEELNRIVVDHLSDLLFATCDDARANLLREGVSEERIVLVGNTMMDTLFRLLPEARLRAAATRTALGLAGKQFALVTLHRPSNVDDPGQLERLLGVLTELSRRIAVVFPMHLRTRERVSRLRVTRGSPSRHSILLTCEPLGYLEFVGLMDAAAAVITDSGGVQEETTALGVPCVTIRTTTERPVTIRLGTNELVDPGDSAAILDASVAAVERGRPLAGPPAIPLWEGRASGRVVEALAKWASVH